MTSTTTAQSLAAMQSAQSAVEDGLSRLAGASQSAPYNITVLQRGVDVPGIYQAITTALATPAITGSVAQIHSIAQTYQDASTQAGNAATAVGTANTEKLPASWSGPAWQSASSVLQAVQTELGDVSAGLGDVVQALNTYAGTLNTVIPKDASGFAALEPIPAEYRTIATANSSATIGRYISVLNSAANALNARVQAWSGLSSAATTLVGLLDQYAATDARAGRLAASTEDADTAVMLAVAQDGGSAAGSLPGTGAGVYVLDANALSLASQRLDAMNAADQAKFQQLLDQAGSPQEAAYLWKALSCGYPISTLEAFDKAIAPFGKNPTLLAQYLDVDLGTSEGNQAPYGSNALYDGQAIFSQGSVNDCVAASTTMAAVENDPVLALFLTRGFPDPQFASLIGSTTTWSGGRFGHDVTTTFPYPAGDSSPAAVAARIQALYQHEYNWGLQNDGVDSLDDLPGIRNVIDLFGSGPGVGEWGQHNLANNLLGNMNGTSYQFVKLNDAADRATALQQIQTSVDSGVPVTFTVRAEGIGNTFNRHQMAIIGSDASTGMLEVYNPWGYTEWISSQDFVDGNVSALTGGQDGGMNLPYGIEIPTSAPSS